MTTTTHVPSRLHSTLAINSDTRHSPDPDCPYHHTTPIMEHHSREGIPSIHYSADPCYHHPQAIPSSMVHSHERTP